MKGVEPNEIPTQGRHNLVDHKRLTAMISYEGHMLNGTRFTA